MTTTIFLDESGYTGYDLVNDRQPTFVLASMCLAEKECEALKVEFFKDVNSKELKHVKLSKRPRQQEMVIQFLKYLEKNRHLFKVSVAHKRYVLVCKLVDLLIETPARNDGLDIYEQGLNISLANLFFYTLPAFGGDDFFAELLERFQIMLRKRSAISYDSFFSLVFQNHDSNDLNEMLQWLQISHFKLGENLFETIPENTLDLALTMTLSLMAEWRLEIAGRIHLLHDMSSNMSRQKEVWDALMDPNLPPAFVGYDRRKMKFPVSVERTIFEHSQNWAGLQLSDVLAGAIDRYSKWLVRGKKPEDSYGKELAGIVGDVLVLPIWPETKFTPEELGTVGEQAGNVFEYYARNIEGRR